MSAGVTRAVGTQSASCMLHCSASTAQLPSQPLEIRKSSKEMPVTVLVDERPVTTGDSLSYPLIDIIVPDTGFDRRPSRAVDSDATATEGTSVTSDDELAADRPRGDTAGGSRPEDIEIPDDPVDDDTASEDAEARDAEDTEI